MESIKKTVTFKADFYEDIQRESTRLGLSETGFMRFAIAGYLKYMEEVHDKANELRLLKEEGYLTDVPVKTFDEMQDGLFCSGIPYDYRVYYSATIGTIILNALGDGIDAEQLVDTLSSSDSLPEAKIEAIRSVLFETSIYYSSGKNLAAWNQRLLRRVRRRIAWWLLDCIGNGDSEEDIISELPVVFPTHELNNIPAYVRDTKEHFAPYINSREFKKEYDGTYDDVFKTPTLELSSKARNLKILEDAGYILEEE